MIKNCESCGKPLGDVAPQKLYCSECKTNIKRERAIVKTKLQRRKAKILRDIAFAQATGQPVKSLSDWCREAAECNLDYGTYRTLVELQGKTFAELKAQNQNRPATHHAHGHHTRSIRDD